MRCPRDRRLSSWCVFSWLCSGPLWVPGRNFIGPVSGPASDSATQAVTTSWGSRPQYVASWCQVTNFPSRASLMNQLSDQRRTSGPEYVGDGFHDARVMDQVPCPVEQEVQVGGGQARLETVAAGAAGLEGLERTPAREGFVFLDGAAGARGSRARETCAISAALR